MENINRILEKLTLNRAKLMMTRFDKELKEIIANDLKSFKAKENQNSADAQGANNMMVA